MVYLLARWVILALAIGATAWLMPGFEVYGGITGLLLVAAVLGLVNAIVRPIVTLLTCPLVLLTLGLFILIINAAMLSLTGWLLPNYLSTGGFWTTLIASLIISLISTVLNTYVHDEGGSRPARP